jgi:ATP-binding cassette, subfamily C, bacterial CydCD
LSVVLFSPGLDEADTGDTADNVGGAPGRGQIDHIPEVRRKDAVSAQANVTEPAPSVPARRSGPFDPRLMRYARTTRRFVVLSVLIGGMTALLVVAQAWLIATVANDAFFHHGSVSSLRDPLGLLLAVIVGRAVLAWATERAAHRASASAKSELRRSAAAHIAALGPAGLDRQDRGRLSVLATTGIDALDGYFSRYLPQLFLAVIVPVTIIGVVAGADPISAVLIAVTVPLIPVFMGLVGLTTRDRTAARMRSLQRLARHFLDVVEGLPTLKVFGRAKVQARAIADVTNRYRTTTMATLKLTFLSSLILELLATVSVALVAVAVGLRLLDADMQFRAALFVLVLAPEAYLPLRALGANFHASADGMKAAEQIFELLETPVGDGGGAGGGTIRPKDTSVRITNLDVTYAGRRIPALHGADLVVEPGEVVALTGPSGCGKSTLLDVVLGLRRPGSGQVLLGGVDLGDLDMDAWRAGIGWVPQRPHLFARTVADNVRIGRPDASDADVADALEAAGLAAAVRRLPRGVETVLGQGGAGLSAGERQRLALARAFVRDAPLLVLDEPTASLDAETETEVLDAVRRLTEGRTALVVAHRPALVALADRVVVLPVPLGVA